MESYYIKKKEDTKQDEHHHLDRNILFPCNHRFKLFSCVFSKIKISHKTTI